MSTLSFPTTSRPRAAASLSGSLRTAVLGGVSALSNEWRIWKASRRLDGLSDEMLHDIGITRGEIETAARWGRPVRS